MKTNKTKNRPKKKYMRHMNSTKKRGVREG